MGLYNRERLDETGVYVYYGSSTWKTGSNLGRYLDVGYGSDDPDQRVDYLIRWGTSDSVTYIPSETTINLKRAIEQNTDKLDSLRHMQDADVRVPDFTSDMLEAGRWLDDGHTLFGRERNHYGGNDISIIEEESNIGRHGSDFWTKHVPVDTEYRVHVIDGSVARIREKQQREEPEGEHPNLIRNFENGYRFVYPDDRPSALYQAVPAVESMELDFGAVDLIIGEDGNPHVLEVNTAPSLDEPTIELYGNQLADMVGVEPVGVEATRLVEDESDGSQEDSDEHDATHSTPEETDSGGADGSQNERESDNALAFLRNAMGGE